MLKYFEHLRQSKEGQDFLIDKMKFYSSLTNYQGLICYPRKSTCAPIAMSENGCEIYQKNTGNWEPCTLIPPNILKFDGILKFHIEGNMLYIVRERPGRNIAVELFDLMSKSIICCVNSTPYESATATFAFPMLYLIGTDRTFYGCVLDDLMLLLFGFING